MKDLNSIRWVLLSAFGAIAIAVSGSVQGQDVAPEQPSLPNSIRDAPADISFCYGIHNTQRLLEVFAQSDFASFLRDSGLSEEIVPVVSQDLLSDELDFGVFSIDFSDTDFTPIPTQSDNEDQIRTDVSSLQKQLLANDACVIGDKSWAVSWEAISQSVLLLHEHVGLVDKGGNNFELSGINEVLENPVVNKVRIPGTLFSFGLSDTKPLERLMIEYRKALSEEDHGEDKWLIEEQRIGNESLVKVSYPLDEWDETPRAEDGDAKEPTDEQKKQTKNMKRILNGRRLFVVFGLAESRLVVFIGEDISQLDHLLGLGAQPANLMSTTTHFERVLPADNETLVASGYTSDRYAKSTQALGGKGFTSYLIDGIAAVFPYIEVDGVPIADMANGMTMGFGLTGVGASLPKRMEEIERQWKDVSLPPRGWAGTISVGPESLVGRTIRTATDDRLPDSGMTIDQHRAAPPVVVFAGQTTSVTKKSFLVFETVNNLLMGYLDLITSFTNDVESSEETSRIGNRLRQMPLRLSNIVHEHLLPALGDGGVMLVVNAADPSDLTHDSTEVANAFLSPFDVSLAIDVQDELELSKAGALLRTWANSYVNQYTRFGNIMTGDNEDVSEIPAPNIQREGRSDVFTFEWPDVESEDKAEVEADQTNDESNDDVSNHQIEESLIGADFHWRLSKNLLVVGTNRRLSNLMLDERPIQAPELNLPGERRTFFHIHPNPYAESVRRFVEMAKDHDPDIEQDDLEEMASFISGIEMFPEVFGETRTHQGKTLGAWKMLLKSSSKQK